MAQKTLFRRISKAYDPNELPMADGPNVFLSEDYAREVGISGRQARERLRRLLLKKEVRRVRTRRAGTITAAWEYLGD
jgi:hypothetical protein